MVNSREVAYLIGALMGDGCFSKQGNSIRIHFGSTDKDFIMHLKNIIQNNFGTAVNVNLKKLSLKNPKWRDFFELTSRTLYSKLSEYMPTKTEIPLFIKKNTNKIKCAFMSGLFDAEGGVSISRIKSRNVLDRRVHCTSSDLILLEEIKKYLKETSIKSFIQDYKTYYTLNIWGYESMTNFQSTVGFKIARKNKKLKKLIGSYKQIHITYPKEVKEAVLKLRNNYCLGATKIQKKAIRRWN